MDLEVYSSGKTVSYGGSYSGGGFVGDGDGGDAYVMSRGGDSRGSGEGGRRFPFYLTDEPASALQSVERKHRFEDALANYSIDSADIGACVLVCVFVCV